MQHDEPPDDERERNFNNIAAAIAVAVLLAIGWFVVHTITANLAMERCLEEGHRFCTPPIETGSH